MSNKSAPKLKSDFMALYKGLAPAGLKKTLSTAAKGAPPPRQKTASGSKRPERSKDSRSAASKGQEQSKSINSLFRSMGKVELPPAEPAPLAAVQSPAHKTKPAADEKKEPLANVVFNHRNISKGTPCSPGSISRGSSTNSKKRNTSAADPVRDSRLNATGNLLKLKPGSAKNTASYKSLASNYLSMFGKKDREASKGSRCSQRKPSANATPKSKAIRAHLGRDKLSKLLQPSTPSEGAKLATEANERITGYLSSNSKRKNSSTSTLNKKPPPEHRASLAFKSSAKLTPSTPATISYIHPKSTIDIKREILANKLSAGVTHKRPTKTSEDALACPPGKASLSKTSGPVLGGFVTQVVSLPFTAKIDNSCSAKTSSSSTSKQRAATANSQASSLKRKKKSAAGPGGTEVRLSLKNPGIFYMQKLEVSFKECAEDEQSVLFRQHFKQTIQTLAMLATIGDNVKPYEDRQRVLMPPLKQPSKRE